MCYCVQNRLAQTGINTTTPDPNSGLDILSTAKDLLIPRFTSLQAEALADNSPAEGMLIYNTEEDYI